MKLRTRLIVAFLVLSVVPLTAVTYFSYTSQVRALQDLATREADALSSDMTQRMQLVTAELSARVEQLADMNEPPVVRVAQRPEPQSAAADSEPTRPAAPTTELGVVAEAAQVAATAVASQPATSTERKSVV